MIPLIEEFKYMEPMSVYSNFRESPYSFFLDSGMDPEKLGRFSFIGLEPFLRFTSNGEESYVNCQGWKKHFTGNPFYILRNFLDKYKSDFRSKDFPFWGGAVGWFSYDLKDRLEKLPDRAINDLQMSDINIGFYDTILIIDNLKKKTYISSSGFPEAGKRRKLRAKARLENFKARLEMFYGDSSFAWDTTYRDSSRLSGIVSGRELSRRGGREPSRSVSRKGEITSNLTKEEYIRAVLKAKEYIRRGDIYQVNFSHRFHTQFAGSPFKLYSALREINPAPFASYLNFGDIKVVSSSPERFIKVSSRNVETRPIKGTMPRGKNAFEDAFFRKKLLKSAKDKAENLMIIDLERNDLGRISEYGSIKVSEFMICEEYPTVFQLTSTIEGRLRKNIDAADILINCFPGGSITGAPKIRSMEIIEELEPVKRGIYTGAIGYLGFNQDMDTSIVIRTIVIKDNKAYFNVGGGIVYDSDPEQEYQETLDKAKALMMAMECENSKLKINN